MPLLALMCMGRSVISSPPRKTQRESILPMRLEAKGLKKVYKGRAVVNGVDLYLNVGEVVGLLGPNGAGKTTTFYMIMGFIKPEEGRVFLGGEEITDLPMHIRARRGIAYLPQEASVFRGLSVEDNLMAIAEVLIRDREKRAKMVEGLLEEFGIEGIRKTKGGSLSGGERRRVEIARALIATPYFLLLDEPFTGIDPIVREEIQNLILRLKRRGIGILITDHNVRETLEITERAYIMYEGKILISGDTKSLIENETARKIYLGERFSI